MLVLTLDYSKRHCYGPDKLGRYTVDGKWDTYCDDWKNHLRNAGQTEFLRWIREFGILVPNIVTGFEDGWLKLGVDQMVTGDEIYCENYGGVVKAFLDVNAGQAFVEIHDFELEMDARVAYDLMYGQYESMLEGVSNDNL